jgi:hypothetical protein
MALHYREYAPRPVTPGELFIGVRFKPGTAAALGIMANEWTDRVEVLEKVVGISTRKEETRLSNVSSEGGFFDQAHLIHEFTHLSGASLSEFCRHLQNVRVGELRSWLPPASIP